eukprot:403345834
MYTPQRMTESSAPLDTKNVNDNLDPISQDAPSALPNPIAKSKSVYFTEQEKNLNFSSNTLMPSSQTLQYKNSAVLSGIQRGYSQMDAGKNLTHEPKIGGSSTGNLSPLKQSQKSLGGLSKRANRISNFAYESDSMSVKHSRRIGRNGGEHVHFDANEHSNMLSGALTADERNLNLSQFNSQNLQNTQGHESLSKLVKQSKYMSNQTDGVLGIIFLLAAGIIFSSTLYAFIISKYFMPYTGNKILDWIKDDEYYCCLIPATICSAAIFTYLNWLAMKYFRQS